MFETSSLFAGFKSQLKFAGENYFGFKRTTHRSEDQSIEFNFTVDSPISEARMKHRSLKILLDIDSHSWLTFILTARDNPLTPPTPTPAHDQVLLPGNTLATPLGKDIVLGDEF